MVAMFLGACREEPMLAKRSTKNQIAIPKALLERAGLGPEDVYFDVRYEDGRIVLVPVEVEEKVSREALARFKDRAVRGQQGDRSFRSMDALIKDLKVKR